jgi:acyl-CoA synthetase (AMP-forming)/AMP-acid ligase II
MSSSANGVATLSQSLVQKSLMPTQQLPLVSLTPFVFQRIKQFADKQAFVDAATGVSVTYAEHERRSHRVAAALYQRGLRKGDVVAILSPNSIDYTSIVYGGLAIGAVLSGMNPAYTPDEVRFQLKDSGARTLFVHAALEANARKAAVGLQQLKEIIVIGGPEFQEMLKTDGKYPDPRINPKTDLAALPYSSGTTGLPKGVMLSHFNLVSQILQVLAMMDPATNAIASGVLPFYHIYGFVLVMMAGLCLGSKIIIFSKFELEPFLAAIQKYRIVKLWAVPPILVALGKHPLVEKYDLSSVKLISSGAAPLGIELADLVSKRLKARVQQGYGMTELSPVSHMPSDNEPVISAASIGKLVLNMEALVVDPVTGIPQPPGKPGELWVRGPNVMVGYWNNAKATAETIDSQGWLHTGDICYVDEKGLYYVVDRLKELIKVKGLQVAPAELESLLLEHPEVADVAVIGIADEFAGELPKAYVVRKEGSRLTGEQLMAWLNPRVAQHKHVRCVEFIAAVPKTPSGKILRKDLRQLHKAKL